MCFIVDVGFSFQYGVSFSTRIALKSCKADA